MTSTINLRMIRRPDISNSGIKYDRFNDVTAYIMAPAVLESWNFFTLENFRLDVTFNLQTGMSITYTA